MLDIILKNLTASALTWTGDLSHQRQTPYPLVYRTTYPADV